jgi:hypothetical protein
MIMNTSGVRIPGDSATKIRWKPPPDSGSFRLRERIPHKWAVGDRIVWIPYFNSMPFSSGEDFTGLFGAVS